MVCGYNRNGVDCQRAVERGTLQCSRHRIETGYCQICNKDRLLKNKRVTLNDSLNQGQVLDSVGIPTAFVYNEDHEVKLQKKLTNLGYINVCPICSYCEDTFSG